MRVLPVNSPKAESEAARPCLHLGPRGERCTRPAGENGFCERHDPKTGFNIAGLLAKRLWAVFALLAVLWPLLVDLVREIIRRLR
jgi:hypothetical protein